MPGASLKRPKSKSFSPSPRRPSRVASLLDAQEQDSRASTGAFYWEGLSELLAPDGRVVGRGYLEMTGYAERLAI